MENKIQRCTRKLNRLVRFIEFGACLGFLDKDTWRVLFPPFDGWDVGCRYCDLEETSLQHGWCMRGKGMHYRGCGFKREWEPNATGEVEQKRN